MMGPPPRTSARLTFTMHQSVLPVAILLHVIMAVVFFLHISLSGGEEVDATAQSPPSAPPPSAPPLPLAPGAEVEMRSEWESLSSDQQLAIYSTIAIAAATALAILLWLAINHELCARRPEVPLRAVLPRAASRLAAAFKQRNTDSYAVKASATLYLPPLTAALLTMHTAKPTGRGNGTPPASRPPLSRTPPSVLTKSPPDRTPSPQQTTPEGAWVSPSSVSSASDSPQEWGGSHSIRPPRTRVLGRRVELQLPGRQVEL